MDIKIDGEAAKEIVHKAIFDSLNSETRNAVIQQAVGALIERPQKDRYSSVTPDTPLEAAFKRAVQDISHEVVREYLKDEAIREGIRQSIFKALDDIVKEKGDWLYDQIGYAVGQKIAEVLGGNV